MQREASTQTIYKDILKQSLQKIEQNQKSVRSVAKQFGLSDVATKTNQGPGRVFSEMKESMLEKYLKELANVYRGLLPKEAQKLVYEFAVEYGGKYLKPWKRTQAAGRGWVTSFVKRHPSLNGCIPGARRFEKCDVNMFFDELQTVLQDYKFTPENIWNVDETQVRTRRDTGNDKIVTVALAVNAQGDTIPPFFVLPVDHFKSNIISDGPSGSSSCVNATGSMQESEFISFLQHFKNVVQPSCKRQCLLLLDNDSSHISIKCFRFCKKNGILLFSFPPYDIYRLQPLQRAIVHPFKKSISDSVNDWEKQNPGENVSILDIPRLVKEAYATSATKSNIVAGFCSTGIWPFDKSKFALQE